MYHKLLQNEINPIVDQLGKVLSQVLLFSKLKKTIYLPMIINNARQIQNQ